MTPPQTQIMWISGHDNVKGNEDADKEAKQASEGHSNQTSEQTSYALSHYHAALIPQNSISDQILCDNGEHTGRPRPIMVELPR
jgi:hypothetical protein